MDTYKKSDSRSESENVTNQLPSLFRQVNVRGSVDSLYDEYGFEITLWCACHISSEAAVKVWEYNYLKKS